MAAIAVGVPHAQAVDLPSPGSSSRGNYAETVTVKPPAATVNQPAVQEATPEIEGAPVVDVRPVEVLAGALRVARAGAPTLTELSADDITKVSKPAKGQKVVDPAYGTSIYRATDVSEGEGGMMRHEYSRRQAFNANNTRYLTQDGRGNWYLYDATTFANLGKISEFAGDCEPIWHGSNPNVIYFTGRNGGMSWWAYDIESKTKTEVFNFTGKTPWPQATSFWTKGEGTTSADGRYLALMATTYDQSTQRNTIYGLVMLDLQEKKIVGTLDAKDFPVPGAFPDHISTSASGKYAVPSWLHGQGGTRAYTQDFSRNVELINGSEHSDLAFGPEGQDYFVVADYSGGAITAIDLDTQERMDLHSLYPASGEAYALHISGQAFDRPGWVVVSTYADNANYGATYPAPTLRPEYRKVWLMELKPGGRKLNVAHIRADEGAVDSNAAYFLEPQATASRDLSKIMFTSNFGEGDVESYIVEVPLGG